MVFSGAKGVKYSSLFMNKAVKILIWIYHQKKICIFCRGVTRHLLFISWGYILLCNVIYLDSTYPA